jgi:uncharacterized protein (DUF488 family)
MRRLGAWQYHEQVRFFDWRMCIALSARIALARARLVFAASKRLISNCHRRVENHLVYAGFFLIMAA